jgi:hypothetical protein
VVDKVWVGVDESAQFHDALDTLQVTAAGLVFRICECRIRGSGCGACDAEMAEYRALGMGFADWGLVDQVEREPGAGEWNFSRVRNSTRVELFQGEKFYTCDEGYAIGHWMLDAIFVIFVDRDMGMSMMASCIGVAGTYVVDGRDKIQSTVSSRLLGLFDLRLFAHLSLVTANENEDDNERRPSACV